MANERRAYPENVDGEFFVDSRCIDCDNCRSLAPEVFVQRPPAAGQDGYSFVARQPETAAEREQAIAALAVCPVACIGSRAGVRPKAAAEAFPLHLEGPVHFLGQSSKKSFGGKAYVADLGDRRVMVDAPRWDRHLVAWFEERGGLDLILLTHRDDVADAPRYAERFGVDVCIGAADADAYDGPGRHPLHPTAPAPLGSLLDGTAGVAPTAWDRVRVLPTPGHTEGSICYLLDDRYLFTGDHIAFSRLTGRPYCFDRHCWYDWGALLTSVRLLLDHPFEWILPAHGRYGHLKWAQMRPMIAEAARSGAA